MYFKSFLIYLCILNTPLQAARILSVFGIPGPSQYAFIEPLLKELAGRGHQITSITNFPQKEPMENFRDVVVKENKHLFDGFINFTVDHIESNYYDNMDALFNKGFKMCLNIFDNPTVRRIMNTETFDLIILEVCFSESFFGLAEHFKAPIVGVSSLGTWISTDNLVGNISPTSYIPNGLLPLGEMNLWQRFLNVLIHLSEWANYYFKYMPIQKQIYERYFPTAKLSFKEAQKNFALVLLNDHYTLTTPRPYVPNMIEVAGLHINTKPEPTPNEIITILDNAQEGIIFIAVDSVITDKVVEVFLKQFKAIKQIVLWKSCQEIVNAPSNVYVNCNYSQTSILAHPNIKLFISQGSFLSVIESIHHGLPILGVATTDTLVDYIDFIKKVGNGISIKQDQISDKTLSTALNDLLNGSYYMGLSKIISKRFRDQQNTPMQKAVYWIEYVLRHNGAGHLRNMGQNLNSFQFYNIDVFILLICIISLFIFLAYVFIIVLVKYMFKISFNKSKKNK